MQEATSGRIRPTEVPWEQFNDPHGRPTTPVRILKMNDPYLLEADFPPNFYAGEHWHPHDTIYIITAGEMRIGSEGSFKPGDVRWVRGGHTYGPEEAGEAGVRFFLLSLGGEIGLNWADLYAVPDSLTGRLRTLDERWGRMTLGTRALQRLPGATQAEGIAAEILSDGHPHLWRLRFEPGATLREHHFRGDVLMLVRSGSIVTEAEGEISPNEFRWVKANRATTAVAAGAAGADLLVIGLDGPIELRTHAA